MYKTFSEIKNFENKKMELISAMAELKAKGSEEIHSLKDICMSLGIKESQIDDMIYYLERGQVIETREDGYRGTLTVYGELLHSGKIKTGYAPL